MQDVVLDLRGPSPQDRGPLLPQHLARGHGFESAVGPQSTRVENRPGQLGLSLVVLFGGLQMTRCRSWVLAVAGSFLCLVPCLLPCCCIWPVGLGVGIWALMVLFRTDVRDAFGRRASSSR